MSQLLTDLCSRQMDDVCVSDDGLRVILNCGTISVTTSVLHSTFDGFELFHSILH